VDDIGAGLGILFMIVALATLLGSIVVGLTGSVGTAERRLRHARTRIGSFAVIFLGAGLLILTRPVDFAVVGALTLFALAAATVMLVFAIRIR
jgi:hypothetical protein